MSAAPRTKPTWIMWVCLAVGLVMLLAGLAELGLYTGPATWKFWQQSQAKGNSIKSLWAKLPPPARAKLAGDLTRDLVLLVVGGLLTAYSTKKPKAPQEAAVIAAEAVGPPAKPHRAAKPRRWQFCNVLQIGADSRRLWTFNAGKNTFNLGQELTIPTAQPLPGRVVGRDWKAVLQPKLNIAWLPVEQVFLRVAQLPAGDLDETLSMVELQLEKLSPLPVTQVVWSVEILPRREDNQQTVIVIVVARDIVEKFLGELEGQGFLADRLELPILDQLLATEIKADGAYIYPDTTTGKLSAIVAWWYGGILRNLGLVFVPAEEDRAAILKEQLAQMAWSGELEGWLTGAPRWELVADEATAANWQPMFQAWLGEPAEMIAPLAPPQLAKTNAIRAARARVADGLMPPEYALRYAQEFHDRLWMRGLFAVLVVYCVAVIIYMAGANVQDFRAQQVETDRASLSRQYTNTLQLKAQLEILQNRQALKFASLDCWKITAELLPTGISVGSLEFKDGKHLSLSGSAPAEKNGELTDFNDALRKATLNGEPMFESLEIPQVKLGQGGATLTWGFSGVLARAEETK